MIRTIYFMIINRPSFALTGIDLCILNKGLVRSSLIPCKEIRELRRYSRKYVRLQQRKTSVIYNFFQIHNPLCKLTLSYFNILLIFRVIITAVGLFLDRDRC